LGKQLPVKQVKAGKEIREALINMGVFRDNGREHLNGSLVLPLHNLEGELTGLYGHKVSNKLRSGTTLELSTNKYFSIWNIFSIHNNSELIVCSNIMDALLCYSIGLTNVIGVFDNQGEIDKGVFSDIYKLAQPRLILVGDLSKSVLIEIGYECYQAALRKNETLVKYASDYPNATEAIGSLIREAEWLSSGNHDAVDVEENIPALLPIQREPDLLNDVVVLNNQHEAEITIADRLYRIRGLANNKQYDRLKVSIKVAIQDRFHIDQFDLYCARHRRMFINSASDELLVKPEVVKSVCWKGVDATGSATALDATG